MSWFSLARLRCVRLSRYSFLVFWMNVSGASGVLMEEERRIGEPPVLLPLPVLPSHVPLLPASSLAAAARLLPACSHFQVLQEHCTLATTATAAYHHVNNAPNLMKA